MNPDFWNGKKVFITGHSGFKGGWLALWLSKLGAEIHGYALQPPTDPNFYHVSSLSTRCATSTFADIRDYSRLRQVLENSEPDIVFHLAAQPLVLDSYRDPIETYSINVMGTVNILEAIRTVPSVQAIINVTSDKCYENQEWMWAYRESDALGGKDPYSSSKACAELVTASWRHSFLRNLNIKMASVRAGNVIGGGDWASSRLIPDIFRALDGKAALSIRSPNAIRPWQHVLEPIHGYIRLAECLVTNEDIFDEPWNFGPEQDDSRPVSWILNYMSQKYPEFKWIDESNQQHAHEAGLLRLDNTKAKCKLGWYPRWNLEKALEMTADWHQAWKQGRSMECFSLSQIDAFTAA